ncbi:MAG TPA: hypothetical protein VH088_13645 [Terriglobales bacterium]|nr:hypothetical protein [Terriglobales bacterium]
MTVAIALRLRQARHQEPMLDCGVFGMYDGQAGSYAGREVGFEESQLISHKPVYGP